MDGAFACQAQCFVQELLAVTHAGSLHDGQKGAKLWNEPGFLGSEQNAEAPHHLDPVQACNFASSFIVHEQAVGMQAFAECHGLELALTQTGHGDDDVLEVDLGKLPLKVHLKSFELRLSRNRTFPKDRGRNPNVAKKLVEKRKCVTYGERDERRAVRDDQHQAFARRPSNSAWSSSAG